MPLPAYGLLIGKVTGSRAQAHGHPHWLAMVAPSTQGHPAYRVAVNLQSTDPDAPPEIEYQVIDVNTQGTPALRDLVARLQAIGQMTSFQTGPDLPTLDFVHDGLVDQTAWQTIPAGANPLQDAFEQALTATLQTDQTDGALLAVFGTGYPVNRATGRPPSTGYTGIDNIHMNQGSPNQVGAGDHYTENGANQDGGLIFLLPDGAKAFFVKFQSQLLDTDANGNPISTGAPSIDRHLDAIGHLIKTDPGIQDSLTAGLRSPPPAPLSASVASGPGFIFADPDPDATEEFIEDKDTFFKTPFVQAQANGQVQGPVPTPRDPPQLDLETVVGPMVPGFVDTNGTQTIAFDMIGDSGAVTAATYKGEQSVGDLITGLAKTSQPAFLYHVGDVVYYYGEKQFYYGQFAEVFQNYPAPIFAIPGNHDGLIHDADQVSLESFLAAFCAEQPGPWDGFGGIRRSTMIQPGVYWTLDAPLVSIIGLYSNCGESRGQINDHQLAFLLGELQRLKPDRDANKRAVILAIHHMPRWHLGNSDPVSKAIDATCTQAGLWPDAVVAGHAHLFQRLTRVKGAADAPHDIPYLINGAGGYKIVALQKSHGGLIDQLAVPSQNHVVDEEGFVRALVTKSANSFTLGFEFHSTKSGVADTCQVDLLTGTLTS
jgi:uncharacterized protein YukJ